MKKAINIDDLNFDHNHWMRMLDFQKEELKYFANRLDETIIRWADKLILSRAEGFKNQFSLTGEKVKTLSHDIKAYAQKLSGFPSALAVTVDHIHFREHEFLQERNETVSKMFNDLRREYMRFLMQTM